MLYRDFATQEEIDAEYNVGALRPDMAVVAQAIERRSAAVRGAHPDANLDVSYGPTRAERLDVLPAGPPTAAPRPVLVFLHGGYWRAGTAEGWSLVATGPLAHGIDVVVVNYALAPTVAIDEITRQCRAAVAWVHGHASAWGGDPARIVVAGHSAGGHLTAMVLATDWVGDYGLATDVVCSGVALSGVFDLRPLPYSYLAPSLQLSRRTIETQSPLMWEAVPPGPPRVVAWGGGETAEFHRQSQAYVAACREAGIDVRELSLGDDDHFQAVIELTDPASELTTAVVQLASASSVDPPRG